MTQQSFTATSSGTCDAILMWWSLKMDQKKEIELSCAPYWAHPDTKGK